MMPDSHSSNLDKEERPEVKMKENPTFPYTVLPKIPKGNFQGGDLTGTGRGRVLMEGSRVAILGFGSIVQTCIKAANSLKEDDIFITLADARFCKPLDAELIRRLTNNHEILITVEEGSVGGFGYHVSHFLSLNGLLDGNLKSRAMVLSQSRAMVLAS